MTAAGQLGATFPGYSWNPVTIAADIRNQQQRALGTVMQELLAAQNTWSQINQSVTKLNTMKGHTYYLYDPAHLRGAAAVGAGAESDVILCGDSLGLAHPLTAATRLAFEAPERRAVDHPPDREVGGPLHVGSLVDILAQQHVVDDRPSRPQLPDTGDALPAEGRV